MREIVRKVQLIGRSTFVVSLPKDWARRMGLTPGATVSLVPEPDGSLRVVPPSLRGPKKPESKLMVTEGMSEGAVIRELMSRYLAGYKLLKVELPVEAHKYREIIRRVIASKMIGVEILEDSERKMVLQVLVNVEELPVTAVVQRMGQIAAGMISDSVEGLLMGNLEFVNEVAERDDLVDKLYLYLLRQLNASIRGFVNVREIGLRCIEESIEYAVVGKSIERVADHSQKIALNAETLIQSSIDVRELGEELKAMASLAREVFVSSVRCFLSRDRSRALNLMDEYPPKLVEAERRLLHKVSEVPYNARGYMPLRLIADSLRRICDYSMDVLEATIDLALEERCR